MQKKILIAVDGSRFSKSALKYAARIAAMAGDLRFVLFHVQPMISGYLAEEALKSPKARAEMEVLKKKNQAAASTLLETGREQLARMGVNADGIEIATHPRKAGLAEDILNAAEAGRYDAIGVGRRGLSAFQELFVGSVASNLVSHSKQIPIWVVDGTVASDNVLIAVDGSINALRAVDHAAFIFSGNERVRFEMLHIQPGLEEFCDMEPEAMEAEHLKKSINEAGRQCVRDFTKKAEARFTDFGIGGSQLNFREIEKRRSPAKAIVEEMEKGDFGTLVLGRQGMGAGSAKAAFMGRVGAAVLQKIDNRAVWIVP